MQTYKSLVTEAEKEITGTDKTIDGDEIVENDDEKPDDIVEDSDALFDAIFPGILKKQDSVEKIKPSESLKPVITDTVTSEKTCGKSVKVIRCLNIASVDKTKTSGVRVELEVGEGTRKQPLALLDTGSDVSLISRPWMTEQAKIGAKHPRSVKMLNTQIKTASEPLKFSVYSGNDFSAKQYIILKTQILRGEKKPKAMHGCFGMIKYWIVDWMPEGIPLLIGREDLARMGITLNVHSFRPSGDPVSEVKQVFKSLFVNTGVESPLSSDPKEQNQWKKDREYRRAKLRYIDAGYEDRRGLTDEQTEGIDREQRIRAENRRA
ncbi:hypothetical protein ADUPG1_002265, partial [Aduncisulcus paluster]